MFGELENIKISIEGKRIKRSSIYEQGKIDVRIQQIVRKLQEKDSRFNHTRENSNDFITLEGNKIAIIRTYLSDTGSVAFSASKAANANYAIAAFTFNPENNEIYEVYFIPKGSDNIRESGKVSRKDLRKNGWECVGIDVLFDKLAKEENR